MGMLKSLLKCCYQRYRWFVVDLRNFPRKALYYFYPVQKNKIVFICYNGKNYSCNPKYIAEEILSQQLDYNLVWLLRDMQEYVPDRIRKVPFEGKKALYELATAKVIITNTKNDLRIFKKKEQYVIHTWHSSFEPKKLEKEAEDKLPKRYIRESKKNSKQTDLFLSNSAMMTEYYRRAFWCKSEIMECGYPRNDVLFNWDMDILKQVRGELGLSEKSKLVLYAPTFRDDGSCDAFDIDCEGILNTLKNTGSEWYLLIRMHPNITMPEGKFPFGEYVLDVSAYPDMQNLLIASNILITDYSSTIYDFAVLKKPSYIYASDIDQYQKMRGLNDFYFKIPYPICRSNVELLEELKKYTHDAGVMAAEQFLEVFGGVDTGNASMRVVEKIESIMKNYK